MKIFLCFTLVVMAYVALATASAIRGDHNETGHHRGDKAQEENMTFLGTIDNKTLYAVHKPRTWFEGGEFCNSRGWTLASIDTVEQFDFLVKHWEIDFSGHHWTDARDSQKLQQFTWQIPGFMPPAPAVVDFRGVDVPYQMCMTYWSVAMLSRSQGEVCTDKHPVLCQELV